MVRYLKGINKYKRKDYTNVNICKVPPSLEEVWNLASVIIVANNNSGSEWNNEIVIDTDDYDDISVKPSSPSGMWRLMRKLFIFDVEYIYLWYGLWLYLTSIMIIFDANYDDLCCYLYICYVYS